MAGKHTSERGFTIIMTNEHGVRGWRDNCYEIIMTIGHEGTIGGIISTEASEVMLCWRNKAMAVNAEREPA